MVNDNSDRYWFARKVVLLLGYLGGNRTCELRTITPDSVKPCPDGYYVSFIPAKQRGTVERSEFLVPKGKTSNGVDCAKIIQEYIEALTNDGILTKPDGPFLFTGSKVGQSRASKFQQSPIGVNTLRLINKEVAEKLNLPDAKRYTGHCSRR